MPDAPVHHPDEAHRRVHAERSAGNVGAYNDHVPPVGDWVMGDTRELTAGLAFRLKLPTHHGSHG